MAYTILTLLILTADLLLAFRLPTTGITWETVGSFELAWIKTPKTWQSARDECRTKYGADLAVDDHQEDIHEFLHKKEHKFEHVWIGLKKKFGTNNKKDTWEWVNGVTLDENHWIQGAPYADPQKDRLCVQMNENVSGTWMNKKCSIKNSFVCQRAKRTTTTTTTTATTTKKKVMTMAPTRQTTKKRKVVSANAAIKTTTTAAPSVEKKPVTPEVIAANLKQATTTLDPRCIGYPNNAACLAAEGFNFGVKCLEQFGDLGHSLLGLFGGLGVF